MTRFEQAVALLHWNEGMSLEEAEEILRPFTDAFTEED